MGGKHGCCVAWGRAGPSTAIVRKPRAEAGRSSRADVGGTSTGRGGNRGHSGTAHVHAEALRLLQLHRIIVLEAGGARQLLPQLHDRGKLLCRCARRQVQRDSRIRYQCKPGHKGKGLRAAARWPL